MAENTVKKSTWGKLLELTQWLGLGVLFKDQIPKWFGQMLEKRGKGLADQAAKEKCKMSALKFILDDAEKAEKKNTIETREEILYLQKKIYFENYCRFFEEIEINATPRKKVTVDGKKTITEDDPEWKSPGTEKMSELLSVPEGDEGEKQFMRILIGMGAIDIAPDGGIRNFLRAWEKIKKSGYDKVATQAGMTTLAIITACGVYAKNVALNGASLTNQAGKNFSQGFKAPAKIGCYVAIGFLIIIIITLLVALATM